MLNAEIIDTMNQEELKAYIRELQAAIGTRKQCAKNKVTLITVLEEFNRAITSNVDPETAKNARRSLSLLGNALQRTLVQTEIVNEQDDRLRDFEEKILDKCR